MRLFLSFSNTVTFLASSSSPFLQLFVRNETFAQSCQFLEFLKHFYDLLLSTKNYCCEPFIYHEITIRFLGQREQTVNDPLRSHFLTNLSKNNWFSRPFSFQEPLRYTTPQESRSIRPYDVILDNRATMEEESEWQPIYK